MTSLHNAYTPPPITSQINTLPQSIYKIIAYTNFFSSFSPTFMCFLIFLFFITEAYKPIFKKQES